MSALDQDGRKPPGPVAEKHNASRDPAEASSKAAEESIEKATESASQGETMHHLPMGPKLYVITLALMLGVFCVALDNNIIAVAIPRITDEFNSLPDIGWYGSAYLLPGCAFQLVFGKLYSLFSVKWVYLSGLLLFEVGTVICGAAPNSTALIVGRAIAGLGSSGLFTGAMLTIAHTVPLAKRPAFMGSIGGVYGIASVVGPLIGGAFTDHVTWRWCFYINLPLGAITAIGFSLKPKVKGQLTASTTPLPEVMKKMDPVGGFIFIAANVCLLLALQWGGLQYSWSNGRIIALLVVFGVAIVVFCALQAWMGHDATVPARIASQRSIAFASLFGICCGGSFFIVTYYVPLWFQAIKNDTPVQAGIHFLPFILPEIFGIIISGILVTAFGYYNPFFIASSVFMSIAAGLCTTFTVDISTGRWVGYQILYGIGVGIGFQQGTVVAQAVLPPEDIAVGTAVVLFVQIFGGAVFVAAAQNIFANKLVQGLLSLSIPELDPQIILNAGALNLRDVALAEDVPRILVKYNAAIVDVFKMALILSCISIIGAVGVEWRSVKKKENEQRQ
ncbi:hypothetical protein PG993_004793 [Apiospora rasikravindrae]|uniref:Major facilitator superfamily (MFS) profile domain-containing protein n=1 Tax=Apiospora rasikravindrae TaxID=990691 RepID=A0ABR1TDR2_9PEZI